MLSASHFLSATMDYSPIKCRFINKINRFARCPGKLENRWSQTRSVLIKMLRGTSFLQQEGHHEDKLTRNFEGE